MLKKRFRLLNADDGQGTGANTDPAPSEPTQKFFTQEEINQMIDGRLSRERKKHEAELEKTRKLAGLSAEEKLQQERDAQAKKMQEYIEKAERLERKQNAQVQLKEYGLSDAFAEFVINADEELQIANIKLLKNSFDASVQEAVRIALAGTTPVQHTNNSTVITKKKSLAELQQEYDKNNKR